MDGHNGKKIRRLIKLDTPEKWRAYEQSQQAYLERVRGSQSASPHSDEAFASASNKKPRQTREQLNRLVTQYGMDSRRNLRKVGLPDDYVFQSYAQLNRAVNALQNNTTITHK